MIGIVGGIGPLAGIDLCRRIVENTYVDKTLNQSDQQHIPFLLASFPERIADRTEFLLEPIGINPGVAIAEIILELVKTGATIIGIACNTAHAPLIFNEILYQIKDTSNVEVINMIDETIQAIKSDFVGIKKLGILSTSGSFEVKLYQNKLSESGFEAIDVENPSLINDAIYNPEYGFKFNTELKKEAKSIIDSAITELKNKGAQGIILGCTEIGMIEDKLELQGLLPINPSTELAKALIRKTQPEKLSKLLKSTEG